MQIHLAPAQKICIALKEKYYVDKCYDLQA